MPNDASGDRLPPRCAAELAFLLSAGSWALPPVVFRLLRHFGYRAAAEELPFWLLLFSGVTAAAALLHLRFRGIPLRRVLGAFPQKAREYGWLFLLLSMMLAGTAAISSLWGVLLKALAIPYQPQQPLLTLAGRLPFPALAAFFLAASVLTPFCEELLFRKLVFDWLRNAGTLTAWIGTAVLFSAVHLFLYGVPGLFLMGLFFQYATWKKDSLWYGILLHAFANGAALCAALAA